MRQLLQTVCDEHPELQQEIVNKAPRPSVESTLAALENYENLFRPFAEKTQDGAAPRVMRLAHPQSKLALSLSRGVLSFVSNTRAYKLAGLMPAGSDDEWKKPEYKWVTT